MSRVVFLVHGFNLYHSIIDTGRDFAGLGVKWLDIRSLCSSYLHLLGHSAKLEKIYYFSAFATHLNDPSVINRHRAYIQCLEATGVMPQLGRFKPKEIACPHCNKRIVRHEEKETDVAIAIRLYELLSNDLCDIVVLVTGDTDLVPAVKHIRSLRPNRSIIFAFPYRRKNAELATLAPGSFKISRHSYVRHQFPDPFTLPDGTRIHKPSTW